MKKAIVLIASVCAITLSVLYVVQNYMRSKRVAMHYPGFSISGKIKRGRRKYVKLGR